MINLSQKKKKCIVSEELFSMLTSVLHGNMFTCTYTQTHTHTYICTHVHMHLCSQRFHSGKSVTSHRENCLSYAVKKWVSNDTGVEESSQSHRKCQVFMRTSHNGARSAALQGQCWVQLHCHLKTKCSGTGFKPGGGCRRIRGSRSGWEAMSLY